MARSGDQAYLSGKVWSSLFAPNPGEGSLEYIPSSSHRVLCREIDINESAKQWSNTLVGYIIGKKLYYNGLKTAIERMWRLEGKVSLTGLDNDVFYLGFLWKMI